MKQMEFIVKTNCGEYILHLDKTRKDFFLALLKKNGDAEYLSEEEIRRTRGVYERELLYSLAGTVTVDERELGLLGCIPADPLREFIPDSLCGYIREYIGIYMLARNGDLIPPSDIKVANVRRI